MLKVEHTIDYLTKEGVNSEITDPIEEEQHTEHVYLAQKQISILKRLKRSDSDNEENIDNPQSGPSGNTAQVSSVDDSEEFFDAEENLEENHEPMEVEQPGTSKQIGTVNGKRPSTEEQDKPEAKKVKLSPQKEKVKERLNTFVKAFVTDFSKELAISHVRAKGKRATQEEVIAELTVGATGVLVSYVVALAVTAIVSSTSASARNIAGKFIHIGKTKAIKITKAFEKAHEGGLSQILSEAAAKIFRSFESQFMIVTDEAGDKMAMRKLAEDAVYRALNHIAKNSEAISSDFITKGVILGKSEGILKRGYTLKDKNGEDLNTGELYKETGVIVNEGTVNRYYSNNRGKYGYRLPLTFEKENGIQHLLTLLGRRQFQEDQHAQETKYIYILQPGDIEKESSEILKEIEKAKPATKGDIETITGILPESAEKLQTLKDIKFIPKDLVENFTGREKELEDLDRLLNPNSDSSDITVIQGIERLSINSSSPKASIGGLGGIGKTQLALKYVEEYSEYYNNNVIWIDAETQSEILNSVRKLLNLSEFGEFRRNLNINSLSEIDSNVTERNIEVIVQEIYKYFKETKSLFIFDNVGSYNEIKEYLPKQLVGDKPGILITSRYRNWENTKVKVLDLDVFTDQEADKFIRNILKVEGNDSSKDQDIKNLASELQRLPLALAQAVAYIKVEGRNINNAFGIQEYLEKYKTEAQKLLDSSHFQKFSHDPYAKTVFTTWKVTLSKIENDNEAGKEAIEILSIMAYLCPDKISNKMFLKLKNSEKLSSAINLLKSYSMINEGTEQNISNIHRLVQKVIRINLEEDEKQLQNIAEKIVQLTKDFNSDKEVELHYLHFLLYIGKSTELTQTLKLLATRERILFIPTYSDHDVSSLTYLLDTSYIIDNKEKHLEFIGEALSVYIKYHSLPFLTGTINYIEKREQEGIISKKDISTILNHTYEISSKNNRGRWLSELSKKNAQRKVLELFYKFKKKKEERFDQPINPTVCSSSQRQKRSTDTICWEDVDEFNEEKEEIRDFSRINIDSEKFIDYIKDLPEEKRIQLIQLADHVQVTGRFQGLVNNLISNQKVMSHLSIVGKISGMAMHGMIAKNVLADFLNGDVEGVAINLGFIAGGQGFARVAQAASVRGAGLVADGRLLLGRALKAASPFLARGTSAFVVYALVNQIKEYKKGNNDTLVGIIGDSIYLGVDSAEIGIEVAEAFEVLEGVSSVTGPIGAAVGAVVFIGTDIYLAVKRVDKIDEIIHLTTKERFIEGLRAFVGMRSESYVEELMQEKEVNDQLVKQGLEYLKQHSDIKNYVFPTGKSVINSCYTIQSIEECPTDLNDKNISCSLLTVKKREKCTTKFQADLNNTVLLDRKRTGIKWNRTKPDSPNGGELFCLPKGNYQSVPDDEVYLCENAIGITDLANSKTGNYTLINLGKGTDYVKGFANSPNIFSVSGGFKNLYGGNKNDIFVFQGNHVEGNIDGGNGIDEVDLENFATMERSIQVRLGRGGYIYCGGNSSVGIKSINKISARKNKKDVVTCAYDTKYVDSRGGESSDSQDIITIPENTTHFYEMQVIVRPSSNINNCASKGIFNYITLPDKGRAQINLLSMVHGTPIDKHNFFFNYNLSDLVSINIQNVRDINFQHINYTIKSITFGFLSINQNLSISNTLHSVFSNKSKEMLNITILNIPANASYTLSDNTEIKIGKSGNLYAVQNVDKSIDQIIKDYPTIANRLNMTLSIKLANNETVVVGHGAHEVIFHNPLSRSHLVGNGGENVYVITLDNQELNTEKLPIPEVVIHGVDRENFTDTIDLRNLIQKRPNGTEFDNWDNHNPEMIISPDGRDLLLVSFLKSHNNETYKYFNIVLKDGMHWYQNIHVITESNPVKIELNGDKYQLKPLPLYIKKDYKYLVIRPSDIEKESKIIIDKEVGNYTFASCSTDLIITNVLDKNINGSDLFTIIFSNFYQAKKVKEKILSVKIEFHDQIIVLKDHEAQINNAASLNAIQQAHNNVRNTILNITNVPETTTTAHQEASTHRIRHSEHSHKLQEQSNVERLVRDRRAIKEVPITNVSTNDNLEFFAAQNNATFVMGNDGISSAARTPSLINDLFGWVKSSIGELFNSRTIESEKTSSSTANDLPKISQVDAQIDVNGTIMLLDLLIRKVTGQKHIPLAGKSVSLLEAQGYASSITLGFDTLLKRTARSCGIQDANFNPVAVQSTIVEQIISGKFSKILETLYSSAEKACPEFKQTDKFLARLKNNLEEVLAEKEVELLVGKQKGLSKGISNNKLVEVPQAKVDNKPNTFLNDTSTSKQLSYVHRVKAESSGLKLGVRIG